MRISQGSLKSIICQTPRPTALADSGLLWGSKRKLIPVGGMGS
jgi:hypothetical protein